MVASINMKKAIGAGEGEYHRYYLIQNSLINSLNNGEITLPWLNAQLAALAQQEKPYQALVIDRDKCAKGLREWEDLYPGKGMLAMQIVGHLYSDKLSFALQPPVDDLESRVVHDAVQWRQSNDPIFPKVRGVILDCDGQRTFSGAFSLSVDLRQYLKNELLHSWSPSVDDAQAVVWQQLSQFFGPVQKAFVISQDLGREEDESALFAEEYLTLLSYWLTFRLHAKTEKELDLLLSLWRQGNYPYRFEAGRVVVRCAPPVKTAE
jgi:hypothetical protein